MQILFHYNHLSHWKHKTVLILPKYLYFLEISACFVYATLHLLINIPFKRTYIIAYVKVKKMKVYSILQYYEYLNYFFSNWNTISISKRYVLHFCKFFFLISFAYLLTTGFAIILNTSSWVESSLNILWNLQQF